jgi:hypothetical protein
LLGTLLREAAASSSHFRAEGGSWDFILEGELDQNVGEQWMHVKSDDRLCD